MYRPLTSRRALSKGDTRARSSRATGCPDADSTAFTIWSSSVGEQLQLGPRPDPAAAGVELGHRGGAGEPLALDQQRDASSTPGDQQRRSSATAIVLCSTLGADAVVHQARCSSVRSSHRRHTELVAAVAVALPWGAAGYQLGVTAMGHGSGLHVLNVITNGASAMKTRIFSVLWLVAVHVAERGIPCSWPDALALLVLVLRAWARPCTAVTVRPQRELGAGQRAGR